MATHAQQLVYRLLNLMPSFYQRQSLQCLFALFLSFRVYRGKGTPTPTQLALKLLNQIPFHGGGHSKLESWLMRALAVRS